MIPQRKDAPTDKERRFYVVAPSSVYLALQTEAVQRETDVWSLGGAVLQAWVTAGCPDIKPDQQGQGEPA